MLVSCQLVRRTGCGALSVKLLSIQVGCIQSYVDHTGKSWESAIDKKAVAGAIQVRRENLQGDEQSDRVHHGGVDKAVLAYSADHFLSWAEGFAGAEKAWTPTAGAFGENLTVTGQTEADVCIGDLYRVGSCQLQVSQPRQPCWKLARRWKLPKLAVRVQKSGRTGWYFRVIQEGIIEAGDLIELIERPNPDWTVARAHAIMHAKPRNASDDLALSNCRELSQSWATQLKRRSRKSIEKSESARLFGPGGQPGTDD